MTAPPILHNESAPPYGAKHAPVRHERAWLGWLAGSDPGLMRLRMAAEIVITIGVVIAAEWIFVRTTGALQTPIPAGAKPAVAAELWTLNHALMVIALMLGAILALISGFGVSMEATARGQLITLLFLPLPLIATLAGGLALHVRLASLASLAVVLAIGTYCRRFGPRGFNGGALAFMGAFLGFFIQDYVKLGNFGWLVAEIWLAMAVIIAVHFAFFRPRPGAALRRMQRSYAARAQQVASEIAEQYQATVRSGGDPARQERANRSLQRQLLRLNEAALLIDARLDDPTAVPAGWSAATLHQRLFDAEVGLSNVARFALAIAPRGLPERFTTPVGHALQRIREDRFTAAADAAAVLEQRLDSDDLDSDDLTTSGHRVTGTDRILLHRFAMSIAEFSAAIDTFRQYPPAPAPDDVPASADRPRPAQSTRPRPSSGPRCRCSAAGCPVRPSSRESRPRSAAVPGWPSGSGWPRTRGPRSRWASRSAAPSSRVTPCPGAGSTGP